MRQPEVKLFHIQFDQNLNLISMLTIYVKIAARQINITYRFRDICNLKEREIIYNTFIVAHFNYCPMVWHFVVKLPLKIKLIQERTFRFLLNDQKST